MENLPTLIPTLFVVITLTTLYLFYKATGKKTAVLIIAILWLAVQALVASKGFYTVTNTIPPRFALLIMPPMVMIAMLFILPKGRAFIDGADAKWLTGLHTIRIAVELVLFGLFTYKYIPHVMTFEGRNFDVLSGISAPFIVYFGYYKRVINRNMLLAWNLVCLALVINIAVTAVLSAPFPFQRFGFEQPNVALLYFPFVWLPCFVVPVVVFSHLACVRQLLMQKP